MHHPCSSKLLICFLAPLKAKPPTREYIANFEKSWTNTKLKRTSVRQVGDFLMARGVQLPDLALVFHSIVRHPHKNLPAAWYCYIAAKKISYKYSFNTSVSTKNVQDKYKVNPYLNLRKNVEYNKLISTSLLLKKFRKLNLHTGFSYLW